MIEITSYWIRAIQLKVDNTIAILVLCDLNHLVLDTSNPTLYKSILYKKTFSEDENLDAESDKTKKIPIGFDNVGYLYNVNTRKPSSENVEANEQDRIVESTMKGDATAAIKHEQELGKAFALPSPARESLLTVALNLLSNKSLLRFTAYVAPDRTLP